MLSSDKLNKLCKKGHVGAEELASRMAHGGFTLDQAARAVKNWQKNLYKPMPKTADVARLAEALNVEANDLSQWSASYRYAPSSARKARLVTELIAGRNVQDALDVLKFEHKRAAGFVRKVLESAIANADEASADVENLYVSQARVDGAGRRIGTKTWIAKDRGRAHPICKEASHIYITVTEE